MSKITERYLRRTPNSRQLYDRSCSVVPGGINHSYRYYRPYPVYMRNGSGGQVSDVDGHEYIDLWSAHYSAILGHRPAFLTQAMARVVEKGPHFGIPSENEVRFAAQVRCIWQRSDDVRGAARPWVHQAPDDPQSRGWVAWS